MFPGKMTCPDGYRNAADGFDYRSLSDDAREAYRAALLGLATAKSVSAHETDVRSWRHPYVAIILGEVFPVGALWRKALVSRKDTAALLL